MTYDLFDDFIKMKTTVYLYSEYTNNEGELKKIPLCRPMKRDVHLIDILGTFKLNYLFKESAYGNNLKDITLKARTYSHGSIEYNDIKMRMPGFTWNGVVKKEEDFDVENQEIYIKRCRRLNENIILNGLVCIEFDEVESKDVPDIIQKALATFPHLVYAGRTLSNKLFCMHRADENLNNKNYIDYFMTLAVMYNNELGIKADSSVNDVARIRYMCDQIGAKVNVKYCDFSPIENIKIEYDKIFNVDETQYIRRAADYKPEKDDKIYDYDSEKGFYYGHTKQHLHKIGDLIVPVPSIEQIINTLVALGKSCDEIIDLWKNTLNYYNYNTNSRDINDNIRLTKKIVKDNREFTIGKFTYNFLLMFFPQILGKKSLFLDKNEFLCDRYYEVLLNSILTHNKILIHGDTGIGKTRFANKIGEERDVIVIVPYKAHMDNYPQYKQIEIKQDMEMLKSGVIIWDRFVRLYNNGLIDENSIIIVDESHKLFLDQTYRKAAIDMNNILRKINNHICYISATPINEIDVEETYRFEKFRKSVNVNYIKIIPTIDSNINKSLTLQAILHLIYGNLNYYDHIFIASDHLAQMIYDRLYGRYDCQLIRASQKDDAEFLELMKKQLLKHKIIIGTCISYESLNFNNKNEKILTISDMNEKTTAQVITQIAGRVRFSHNKVHLVELVQTIEAIDYQKEAEYYNKINEIKNKYNIYNRNHYVQNNADVLEDVNLWYLENNTIETIKENLPEYINWTESEILANNISDKSPLNEETKNYIIEYLQKYDNEMFNNTDILLKDEDDYMCDFFNNTNFIRINEEAQSGYIIRENIREQQYSYSKLLTYIDNKKINEFIVKSHNMPKGVNKDILRILDIIKLDESIYVDYICELELYLKNLNGIYEKRLERDINEIKNIRKKYRKCYVDDEYTTYNNIFEEYKKDKINKYNKRLENSSKGGKKTKMIKDLKTGKIYDSVIACAADIGHHRHYISKHKDRFELVK